MRKIKFLGFILILFLASCGDDDVKSFDSSKLEGIWLNMCSILKLLILVELSFMNQIGLMKDGRLLTFITELVKQHI